MYTVQIDPTSKTKQTKTIKTKLIYIRQNNHTHNTILNSKADEMKAYIFGYRYRVSVKHTISGPSRKSCILEQGFLFLVQSDDNSGVLLDLT